MAKQWAAQMRARERDRKRRERDRKARIRRRKIQAVRHPVKTALRRWGLR